MRPKPEIYTPKRDDEHPYPFHMGSPPPGLQTSYLTEIIPITETLWGGGFQVTGMIEWGQNSKPQKILRASNKTHKIPGPKFTPQKSNDDFPSHKNFQKASNNTVKFRMKAPPCINPQSGNAKSPPLNRPSRCKPPGGLYLENCPQIQSETKQKR